jgi:N-methylhydantoinase B/oxoprolinase/acetone carboxylase alpha subunit
MAQKAAARDMAERGKLDPFTAEIIRSYLLSTVREMYQTTIRTAYSTCFSEGEDFTCGLFDARGRLIAQDYGLPVHSGGLADAMQTIREAYAGEFREADVILHNDPYHGGSHQPDVTVARPIFVRGRPFGFAVNRGHWTDIGGMAPGGWSGTVRHVVQEALTIPPAKLYRAGALNREVKDFILKNVRMGKQCWGDIQAQIASNIVAERRIRSLVLKYGLGVVEEGMEEALEYSRRRFMRGLKQLPDGEYHGWEIQEDDGHGGGPYRINVTVTKAGHQAIVDFAGTDRQVRGPVNGSFSVTKAAAYSAMIAVVDPFIPLNSGVLDLIEVRAPEGSMVRPVYPAPVFCSTADPADKVSEAMLRALAEMAPDRVRAGSYCTANNATASGEDPETGEDFLWYVFESGGVGARPNKDGLNAEWHLMSNCKNESMEIWESRYPVQFERYALVMDSGGAGKYRGGLGVTRHIKVLLPTYVTACADRHQVPPWGLADGKSGRPNRFSVVRDGQEYDFPTLFGTRSPAKFSLAPLRPGDIFCVTQGGGGGYGDPSERDPAKVADDVLHRYVSLEKAREEYCVWFDGESATVDWQKTQELRAQAAGGP